MWVELSLEVDPRDVELVADIVRQRCPNVAVEYRGPFALPEPWPAPVEASPALRATSALVRIYLPADEADARLRRSLRLALRFAPLARPARWRRARRLRDEDWQRAWQRRLRARRIGRLLVRPSWDTATAKAGEVAIEIEPGMAFGTGEHPTTALCLRALAELVRGGESVLDLGTGSGILAIAAAKLGAARVLALDIDPQAVRAARENARRNGVEGVIDVHQGTLTPGMTARARYDLICANIDGLTLERLAPLLARALGPGGRLVLSGFLSESARALAEAFSALGLRPLAELHEAPWAALVLEKADA